MKAGIVSAIKRSQHEDRQAKPFLCSIFAGLLSAHLLLLCTLLFVTLYLRCLMSVSVISSFTSSPYDSKYSARMEPCGKTS